MIRQMLRRITTRFVRIGRLRSLGQLTRTRHTKRRGYIDVRGWSDAFPDYADENTGQLADGVTEMTRTVPIEIYPQVAARYALLHVFLGLTALTIAFAVVERRSP